ncbi:MAG: PilZ domain-containing protein [Planctomycetes bacterium]|nr:PilZ domain-containing protein [Planctomycetota bacterium]
MSDEAFSSGSSRRDPRIGSSSFKRRYDRFEVRDCRAEILTGGIFGLGKKRDIGGPILDMSDYGMRFLSSDRLVLGTVYPATLKFVPIGQKMEIKAVVRWCHQNPTAQGRLVIGAEFEGLNDEHRAIIDKLRERFKQPHVP